MLPGIWWFTWQGRKGISCVKKIAFYTAIAFLLLTTGDIQASPSSCTLIGATSPKQKTAQGFESLKGVIHLNFRAETLTACKDAIDEYCRAMVARGFLPRFLSGYFHDATDSSISEEFNIDKNCTNSN